MEKDFREIDRMAKAGPSKEIIDEVDLHGKHLAPVLAVDYGLTFCQPKYKTDNLTG
jgi:hypothetical protein